MQPDPQARPPVSFTSTARTTDARAAASAGIFLPTLLLALAFVAWLTFQAVQQVAERQQIALAQANLEPQEQAATKLRASLELLATSTARLATAGNANARVVVEELRKRGVTINPAAASAPK